MQFKHKHLGKLLTRVNLLWLLALLTLSGCSLLPGSKAGAANQPQGSTADVTVGTLAVTVASSGNTTYSNKAQLSFDTSGSTDRVKVEKVFVKWGQTVSKGEALAQLDTADLLVNVQQARQGLLRAQKALDDYKNQFSAAAVAKSQAAVADANAALAAAQDSYDKVKTPMDSDLQLSRLAVSNARIAVQTAQTALNNASGDARTALDSAKQSLTASQLDWGVKVDQAARKVTDLEDAYLKVLLKFYPATLGASLQLKSPSEILGPNALVATPVQDAWNSLFDGRRSLDSVTQQSQKAMAAAQDSVRQAQQNLDMTLPPNGILLEGKQKELDLAKARLQDAETNLAKMLTGGDPIVLLQRASALERAKANLLSAQEDLSTMLLGPDKYQLGILQIALESANTTLGKAQSLLDNATLRAPFDGIVGTVNVQDGQPFAAAGTAIVLVEPGAVDVTISVDEIDVSRLRVGQDASLSLEAFQGLNLRGQVASIAPLGRTQQGVVSYDVSIAILGPAAGAGAGTGQRPQQSRSGQQPTQGQSGGASAQAAQGQSAQRFAGQGQARGTSGSASPLNMTLREGMTVTANITVQQKDNVLLVPNRAVRTSAGARVVDVLENGKLVTKPVQIGLTNDQFSEVLSGLQEGDKVNIPSPTAAGQTTQQPRMGGIPGISGGMR